LTAKPHKIISVGKKDFIKKLCLIKPLDQIKFTQIKFFKKWLKWNILPRILKIIMRMLTNYINLVNSLLTIPKIFLFFR